MTLTSTQTKARILLVDDHEVVRRGLSFLITNEQDLEVCGETATALEAISLQAALHSDLMIIDLVLKEGHGLDLIKQIRAQDSEVKMLVLSMHDESLYAERVLRMGAQGYINKEEAGENVIKAIRLVLQGKIYLSGSMTEQVVRRVADGGEMLPRLPIESLSDRELTVFEMVGQGLSTRAIADSLCLSVKTIETYKEHIKTKLALKNSAELGRDAARWLVERE